MKLTRPGWGCAVSLVLALFAAASSGNNLIYLLYSALLAVLAVSWFVGQANLRRLEASVEGPDQIFRGSAFPLTVRLHNTGRSRSEISARSPGWKPSMRA